MTEFFTDFGLRDWLLILGPIFIAGILIHGYWRMRTNRNSLKMSLDKSFVSDIKDDVENGDELSMLRAELPNGGARVKIPEQTSLNLEEAVPVLMDPIVDDAGSSPAKSKPALDKRADHETKKGADERPAKKADKPVNKMSESAAVSETPSEAPSKSQSEPQSKPRSDSGQRPIPKDLPEKYMVLNVMSVGSPFNGQELLECLVEQDMALGEMSIFHRERSGQTQFSLMNAVEPGSFDINEMSQIKTPAISMFMRVHELRKPSVVFEEMLGVADALAEELGGEVRDETRSVMTTQTIEHCRQELEEYEFKNPV